MGGLRRIDIDVAAAAVNEANVGTADIGAAAVVPRNLTCIIYGGRFSRDGSRRSDISIAATAVKETNGSATVSIIASYLAGIIDGDWIGESDSRRSDMSICATAIKKPNVKGGGADIVPGDLPHIIDRAWFNIGGFRRIDVGVDVNHVTGPH